MRSGRRKRVRGVGLYSEVWLADVGDLIGQISMLEAEIREAQAKSTP